MPQATKELRDKMIALFGNIGDGGPWRQLKDRGYTEKRYLIFKPSPDHVITELEGDCIDFLCDEWDWEFSGK